MSTQSSAQTLEAKPRTEKGKNEARRLRRAGMIPANLIGGGKAETLQIERRVFDRMLQHGLRQSQVIELVINGSPVNVIVKEIQREPIKGFVQHVDFIRVENGKKTLLRIAVETKGVAKGVKMGGALEHFVRSLKVKAAPESFVDAVTVDISDLGVNEAVKLADLDIPSSWEVLLSGNPIILKVAPGRMQKAEAPAANTLSEEPAQKEA